MKMERDFTCGREEGWFNSRGSKYLSVDEGGVQNFDAVAQATP